MRRRKVGTSFFAGDTLEVARSLVGAEIEHGECSGVVVEVEAYTDDAASHFVTRPRAGAPLMGSTHGRVYVYRIYGQHLCLNFTTDAHGPGAVLVRAIEPKSGLDVMRARRGPRIVDRDLARGPGRLAQALGITQELNGERVADAFAIRPSAGAVAVATGPRVGITAACELPWRFFVPGSRWVSRHPASP